MSPNKQSKQKGIRLTQNEILRLQGAANGNILLKRSEKEFEIVEGERQKQIVKWPEKKQRSKIRDAEDLEAQIEANHYLARAKQMQLEQEDDIKRANKIILATKCQAIRDAQMAEKELMLQRQKAEEERMDRMMEEERIKGLQLQAKRLESKQIQRSYYVQNLVQQINENEMKKMSEQEKYHKESKKLQEIHKQLDLQEAEEKKKKAEEQLKIRKELNKMNETIKHRHQLEIVEDKLAQLRIQQYMQEKATREAEREEKKRKAKIAQELEITRLRACQVRQQEVEARAVAESVERKQEIVARAWRLKELESAKVRMKLKRDLREARAKQADEKKRQRELELERESREVEELLKKLEEDKRAQQEERAKHEQEMLKYRKSLQEQMLEKQKRMEILREQKYVEAQQEAERKAAKESELKGLCDMKLKELKKQKVPEKYVVCVKNQLGLK